uniref:Uncharacterized protein n=1 Tax=Chenopodium quinoa TaxID=63459 RepID=A0A803LGR9_CHEQI
MDVSGGLSLVQTILQVLGSPTWMKFEAVLSVKSRLNKLKDTMSTIEALLLDAHEIEQLQQHRFTHIERDRLQRLKEALYQTDDLFDEIATLGHLKELMPCSNYKMCNEGRCFFSCSNQLCYAFKWSREMDNIMEMLDATVKDHRFDFGLRHPTGLGLKKERLNARETYSYVCEGDVMIGREEDKRKVIDVMLLNTTVEQQDGFVVSIVGIGGLGKTTLARQVYNDEMIVEKFPRKLWVCVSDDFNVKALVGQILAAVNPLIKQDQMKLEELQTDLRKELDGKRYLLVLDDVWNEDSNKWLELRNVLIGGGRISGIVVTTRSKRVAEVVGSLYTHTLMGLSEDESLELLKKMALKPEEYPMKPQLVDIGRQIVQKCANVPLAIRVVGSLLRGQDESRWQYLEKTNLASVLQDESSGILPVLKISYYYLPFHLKSCFSYCAVYPKDYKFVKEDLICLWMAQGFIMPSDGKSLEDTGEEYFEQLLQRCFFQDIERSEGTNEIISFKMHDLIHDLASEVAGTEIVSSNCNPSCLNEKTRHISIDESSKLRTSDKMKRLRTFLFTDRSLRFWLKSSKKMKYLRVLRLNDSFLQTKLPGVGKLVHLRYLDLSHNRGLRVLPSSITNLYNLQTLKLYKCTSLESLPRDLRKLVNLRLLDIYGCRSLTCMPPGMNSMASLQNLTGFVVGGTSNAWYRGSAGVFKLENLKNLIRHSEILEIVVKKGVKYNAVESRKGGFLCESKKLRNIRYYWIGWLHSNESDNAEALLQSLHPNSYLRKLELQGYPGVRLPSWTMNLNTSLPNLVEIVIHGCDMLEHIPLMSQLRHLKVLELDGLYTVEYVESSNNSGGEDELSETPQAPKLSHLEIHGCPELTTFPLCRGLQQLDLKDFNEALGPLIRETTQQKEEERHRRLREVRIDNLAYLNSLPIRSFHHISNFRINEDQKIEELKTGEVGEVFRSGRLSSLRSLDIWRCYNLKSISGRGVWDQFTALEGLSLCYLPELELEDEDDVINNKSTEEGCINNNNEGSDAEMPWRYLAPTLRSLRLESLPKVVKLLRGIGCLSSLHSLTLWRLPKVVKLPKGIGCLSSLHSLEIGFCDNLESLTPSIGGLSSLQSLEIEYCLKLKRMPEEMRHLTSLTKLHIWKCSPELMKECKNKNGANWSNIQHIPDIKLVLSPVVGGVCGLRRRHCGLCSPVVMEGSWVCSGSLLLPTFFIGLRLSAKSGIILMLSLLARLVI